MKRILITGSSGFLGNELVNYLAKFDYSILCYDLKKIQHIQRNVHEVDESFFKERQNTDVIVHLAHCGYPDDNVKSCKSDIEKNTFKAIELLDFATRNAVKKFIFMSSGGAVYGDGTSEKENEESSTDPISSYGITKLMIEKYLHLYKNMFGIDVCSLRLSNPYSDRYIPGRKQGVIPIFCHKILNHEELQVFGDGENIRDYIHIDDVVEAIRCVIESNVEIERLNIGSGVGTSLNQVIKMIEDISGERAIIKYLPERACDVKRNILDVQLAWKIFGWKKKKDLRDGISNMIQQMKREKEL